MNASCQIFPHIILSTPVILSFFSINLWIRLIYVENSWIPSFTSRLHLRHGSQPRLVQSAEFGRILTQVGSLISRCLQFICFDFNSDNGVDDRTMISAPLQPTHVPSLSLQDPNQVQVCILRSAEQECVSLLKRCNNMEEFKQVHGGILKCGMFCNPFCASNLVATCALSAWGSMAYACSIFRQIQEPHVFDYNTMIKACVKRDTDYFEFALKLFVQMLERGVEPDRFTYPALLTACAQMRAVEEGMQIHGDIIRSGLEGDHYVQNSLINFYGKCRKIEFSCAVFERMEEKSVASWSAVIAAHASSELWNECLILLREMNGLGFCRVEESVLVSVLSACTHLGALHQGKCIHGSLLRNIRGLNVVVQTSLIDMYMKCGWFEQGLLIFKNMKNKNRNHLTYSAVISGLAMHGRGWEALRHFQDMVQEGFEPDQVVYIGVLTACSHAGLVEEGLGFFKKMKLDHCIEPTVHHYGCMVDLLSRAGQLQEALELIRNMPMEPNEVIWRSLLSACKFHGEIKIGEIAADNVFRFGSGNRGDYLALSGLYAGAKRWDDVAKVWKEMAEKGIILAQSPGFSSVEVNRKMHRFVSQDKKFPQCDGVHDMIHQMEWQLKFEGYSPDTSVVTIDGDEEEKKQRLRGHSQKLAIAFALIHTSQGSPLRITRNLRMCRDCHTYTKYISRIYDREITVRDRYRFHHFKDGTCSCRDYW